MALIGRLFVIAFALFVAATASGMLVAFLALGALFSGDWMGRVYYWGTTAPSFSFAGGWLLVFIGVAVTEGLKLRSLLLYVAGAALLFLAAYYASGAPSLYEESIDAAPPLLSRGMEWSAAAGAAFGFIYWAIAGRNAGRWHERKAAPPELR